MNPLPQIVALLIFLVTSSLWATPITTPLEPDDLDPAAFSEWIDGETKLISGQTRSNAPDWLVWTTKTEPGHSGRKYGESRSPGVRHLRLGFHRQVDVGSVMVSGGGRLSVLKAETPYPGNPAREEDWTPAGRIVAGAVSQAEVEAGELAIWVLPPATRTRALRFTHVAPSSAASYAGTIGAAFVASERWTNLAAGATATASANTQKAERLNDGQSESDGTWDNISARGSDVPSPSAISSTNAPWVMLAWPEPVTLSALAAIKAGVSALEVEAYGGPADRHPRDAVDADWTPAATFTGLRNGYPVPLWPNFLALPKAITARAIRVKLTSVTEEGHNHLKGDTKDGKRVWLGELMALHPLDEAALQPTRTPSTIEKPHPPIPVKFTLAEAGFVTLVIEDDTGKRVRNLTSETPFPAGENVAWWDGTDDLGRDVDAARHGVYKIPARFVTPGKYTVRGLVRGEIEPRYEFPIYTAGNPAWETADKSGGWLTNHTPPQAALFVPALVSPTGAPMVYLGSAVSEGGAGLAWVDLEGRKIGGRGWIGGNWTAAPFLTRDAGPQAAPKVYAYVGATWTASTDNSDKTRGELRITGLTAADDKPILKHAFTPPPAARHGDRHWIDQLGGLAAYNGTIVASMRMLETLLVFHGADGRLLRSVPCKSPRGIAFDSRGRLLVLSGTELLRFDDLGAGVPHPLVRGLEDPQGIALDGEGRIFISDHGKSHQVKVYNTNGKLTRTVGLPGEPKAGPCDPLHMNHPTGLAIDANNRLWVTENDYLPKRVSVWNPDGTMWRAFYGPAKYGGGGTVDSQDKKRFYYADEEHGAMEFKLDWDKGSSELARVYYRHDEASLVLPERAAAPELALYHEGRRYFTNCYNSNPTGGSTAFLFVERDGIARPVAGMGRAASWPLLKTPPFAGGLPPGADWKDKAPGFIWSDGNDDAQVQPQEVTFTASQINGVTVMADLSFCAARVGGKTMRFRPVSFSKGGAPLYESAKGEILAEDVGNPASSGGDQALAGPDGWTAITLGVAPFAPQSLSGTRDGKPQWSYPSVWPGLHAAHEAPAPDRPGQLIGTTRLLGGFITPRDSDAGPLWAINANMGTIYLFTYDGLFVATVFEDKREGKSWAMPAPERNMSLKGFTLGEENFWPTWSQTPDGSVYVMNGAKASLVRLDGLSTIRRLPASSLDVTPKHLNQAQAWLVDLEAQSQERDGRGVLNIGMSDPAPKIDGQLDDWPTAAWVDIDKSGVSANFNSNSKPYDITAALRISGDRLYAAFRTGDEKLLQNSGEVANAPFKTGGALDLMLGVSPAADPRRTSPVEGDLRLLVTMVQGKARAMLYRAVVPGAKEPVPFSSPWRTITLDRVEDVSDRVQLAGTAGNYEYSIPLATLGLEAKAGRSMKGDIGILRGNGRETTARVYWSNKATGITSDVPSEAQLTPQLWGRAVFKTNASDPAP